MRLLAAFVFTALTFITGGVIALAAANTRPLPVVPSAVQVATAEMAVASPALDRCNFR